MRIPYFRQELPYSCGPACLKMVLVSFGLVFEESKLRERCGTTSLGTSLFDLADAARGVGLDAEVLIGPTEMKRWRRSRKRAVIALLDASVLYGGIGPSGHFVVIITLRRGEVIYHDPAMGQNLHADERSFFEAWQAFDFRGVRIWRSTRR